MSIRARRPGLCDPQCVNCCFSTFDEPMTKDCEKCGPRLRDIERQKKIADKQAESDSISRQAAIDVLKEADNVGVCWKGGYVQRHSDFEEAINCIKELPPTEPKHGKWIPIRSYEAFGGDEMMWTIRGNPIAFYYCSNCRNDAYAGEDGESLLTKYCPECGAKMEK